MNPSIVTTLIVGAILAGLIQYHNYSLRKDLRAEAVELHNEAQANTRALRVEIAELLERVSQVETRMDRLEISVDKLSGHVTELKEQHEARHDPDA